MTRYAALERREERVALDKWSASRRSPSSVRPARGTTGLLRSASRRDPSLDERGVLVGRIALSAFDSRDHLLRETEDRSELTLGHISLEATGAHSASE